MTKKYHKPTEGTHVFPRVESTIDWADVSSDAENPTWITKAEQDDGIQWGRGLLSYSVDADVSDHTIVDKRRAHDVTIFGYDSDNSDEFADKILNHGNSHGDSDKYATAERGSPANRSYSSNGNWKLMLSLDGDSSDTYRLFVSVETFGSGFL